MNYNHSASLFIKDLHSKHLVEKLRFKAVLHNKAVVAQTFETRFRQIWYFFIPFKSHVFFVTFGIKHFQVAIEKIIEL